MKGLARLRQRLDTLISQFPEPGPEGGHAWSAFIDEDRGLMEISCCWYCMMPYAKCFDDAGRVRLCQSSLSDRDPRRARGLQYSLQPMGMGGWDETSTLARRTDDGELVFVTDQDEIDELLDLKASVAPPVPDWPSSEPTSPRGPEKRPQHTAESQKQVLDDLQPPENAAAARSEPPRIITLSPYAEESDPWEGIDKNQIPYGGPGLDELDRAAQRRQESEHVFETIRLLDERVRRRLEKDG